MCGCRAAATADQVQQSIAGKIAQDFGHVSRGVVILAQFIGQPGIGIQADRAVGYTGKFLDPRTDFGGAEGTVQTDRKGPGMTY